MHDFWFIVVLRAIKMVQAARTNSNSAHNSVPSIALHHVWNLYHFLLFFLIHVISSCIICGLFVCCDQWRWFWAALSSSWWILLLLAPQNWSNIYHFIWANTTGVPLRSSAPYLSLSFGEAEVVLSKCLQGQLIGIKC